MRQFNWKSRVYLLFAIFVSALSYVFVLDNMEFEPSPAMAMCCGSGATGAGATGTSSGNFEVSELRKLTFETLEIPASGSTYLTIANNGNESGTATVVSGDPISGRFRVKQQILTGTITIDISSSASSGGLDVDSYTITYDGTDYGSPPASGLPDPTSAGKILLVGATATISSSATEGTTSPAFDIEVTNP